jgi:hypothetical protein
MKWQFLKGQLKWWNADDDIMLLSQTKIAHWACNDSNWLKVN